MYTVGKCLLLDKLQKQGISQSELALKLGVSRQQVNALVHNRKIMSYQTAYNVALILKCDMSELYEFEVSNE